MDTSKHTAAVFLLLLGLATAAYGQPAPCSLLTQARVTSVLGVDVGAGTPIATTGCSWKSTGASRVVVTVSMQSSKMYDAAKSSTPPESTKTSISGVGDEAVFIGLDKFASLWVKKSATCFLVRIYGLPVNDAQDKTKPLAQTVASKL